MNNTVSPKQVKAIATAVDEIMSSAKVKAENIGNAYFGKVKKLWADARAVEFANIVAQDMGDTVKQLASGGNALKDGLFNIANFYARKAGKPSMNGSHLSFNAAINPSVVTDSFDGDEYGFKDPSAIGDIVAEATNLANEYKKLGEETASRLASINAFGNPEIKAKLLSSANGVIENLVAAGKNIEKNTENKLQQAAKEYNISDISAYFKDAASHISDKLVSGAGAAAGGIASGASSAGELLETAVKDPELFRDAFTYAITGTDSRGIMNDK